jgi:hypothetical protein
LDDYILSVSHQDFVACITKILPELAEENVTFDQAIQHLGWTAAMEDKLSSIAKNKTWALVDCPPGNLCNYSEMGIQNQTKNQWIET